LKTEAFVLLDKLPLFFPIVPRPFNYMSTSRFDARPGCYMNATPDIEQYKSPIAGYTANFEYYDHTTSNVHDHVPLKFSGIVK
jgi:hypothetical protein